MRRFALPAGAGERDKGSLDFRQIGARNSRHPSGRISHHGRIFCAGIPNRLRQSHV